MDDDRWSIPEHRHRHQRLRPFDPPQFSLDIEVSNRCNAGCDFCPRDLTPHQGTMSAVVFEQVLRRATEFRDVMAGELEGQVHLSFCGLGEPSLNPRLTDYLRRATAAGFEVSMATNGSLLTEELSREVIDGGLKGLYVNCAEIGDEYTEVYKVPFERMRQNVVRFLELAEGRCDLHIVLVDHLQDRARVAEVRRFWQEQGVVHFFDSPMLNRGGSMDVDGMAFRDYPEHATAQALFAGRDGKAMCAAPFLFPFIGYDGNYYLCSSDWEKRTAMGSVHDRSILSLLDQKRAFVSNPGPACDDCCHHPVNAVTMALRQDAANGTDRASMLRALSDQRLEILDELLDAESAILASHSEPAPAPPGRERRLLPVRAV
jgi:MoaA/NifB/PqqE/SkfB family radical SAM enzyme